MYKVSEILIQFQHFWATSFFFAYLEARTTFMKKFALFLTALLTCCIASNGAKALLNYLPDFPDISEEKVPGSFPLVSAKAAGIFYDKADSPVVGMKRCRPCSLRTV